MSEGTRRRGEAVGCLSASPQRGARVPWSFLPFAANGHGWRHDRYSVLRTIRRFSRGSCTQVQVAGGARAGPLLPLDIHHELRTPSPFLGELASKGLVTGSMLPARCSRLNLTPSSCAVPIWLVVGLTLAVQCCESVTAPIEKSQLCKCCDWTLRVAPRPAHCCEIVAVCCFFHQVPPTRRPGTLNFCP